MNQLGKNLVLSLCLVATLLVILGVKRKFGGEGGATLLSQQANQPTASAPTPSRGSPHPRVLQAKPVAQHDQAIASPTTTRYADAETDASPAGSYHLSPVPTAMPGSAAPARPLDAPDLVPVANTTESPVAGSVSDKGLAPLTGPRSGDLGYPITVPVASRTLPEFVLTAAEDSFWSISERVYGSGVYYRALFRHNESKVLRPDQLRPGIQVNTPPLDVLRDRYPADFPADFPTAP